MATRWAFLDSWWDVIDERVYLLTKQEEERGLESYDSICVFPPQPGDAHFTETWTKQCEALILVSMVAVIDPDAWKQTLRAHDGCQDWRESTWRVNTDDMLPRLTLNVLIRSAAPTYACELLQSRFAARPHGQRSAEFYATPSQILEETGVSDTIRLACERQVIPVTLKVYERHGCRWDLHS